MPKTCCYPNAERRMRVNGTEAWTRKEKSESPPQLYDLTALAAGCKPPAGIYSAQQTLDYAQSLYEKRLITYPRTDSRFLTEDMSSIPSGAG